MILDASFIFFSFALVWWTHLRTKTSQPPHTIAKRLLYIHWMSSFHLFVRYTHFSWHYSFHTFFTWHVVCVCMWLNHTHFQQTVLPRCNLPYADTLSYRYLVNDVWCGCEFKRAIKCEKSPKRNKRFEPISKCHEKTKKCYDHIKKIVTNKIKYLISFWIFTSSAVDVDTIAAGPFLTFSLFEIFINFELFVSFFMVFYS